MEDQLTQAASEYTKLNVQIGETHFEIRKLLVMDSFAVLEELREGLGEQLGEVDSDDPLQVTMVKTILSAPRELVISIRDQLFANVLFRNESYRTPMILAGMEEAAFDGLTPIDVYEMLVRCLAVNFFDTFREIASKLGVGLSNGAELNPPTSTPPSSP